MPLSLIIVPVCVVAGYVSLRLTPLSWNVAAALSLVALPFAPAASLAYLLGVLLGYRRGVRIPRGRRAASDGGGLAIGTDRAGRLVRIPLRERSGSHTLVVGATGSGKTVTEAWIVGRAIEHGHGAVIIDPKGDELLRNAARTAARTAGREFVEWTPRGSAVYNPYAHGSASEIADKALAGELFTEPHYLRQSQRYLGNAVRAITAAGETPTPRRLVEMMDPRELEQVARGLADEALARSLFAYLDSLDGRQRAGLTGTRDRIAILAESEMGPWLDPASRGPRLDLLDAVRERAVVYFRLEADRLPLLARMLGAAIVQDLLTVSAECQQSPVPTLVALDEFSALGTAAVARLFGRARAAGLSLLLATQEVADLRAADDELLDQVLGNVETVVAHRQSVPESAELIARIAGTHVVWARTEQLSHGFANGHATQTQGREYLIHPDEIKSLTPGVAAVARAGGSCAVTRIFHP